ncbi:MAG: hypothetical protein V3R13_02710, partial [Nitrososphaerales archaeon]
QGRRPSAGGEEHEQGEAAQPVAVPKRGVLRPSHVSGGWGEEPTVHAGGQRREPAEPAWHDSLRTTRVIVAPTMTPGADASATPRVMPAQQTGCQGNKLRRLGRVTASYEGC